MVLAVVLAVVSYGVGAVGWQWCWQWCVMVLAVVLAVVFVVQAVVMWQPVARVVKEKCGFMHGRGECELWCRRVALKLAWKSGLAIRETGFQSCVCVSAHMHAQACKPEPV